MDQFTVELATSILHLEMQKEKILKEDELENTLCICRRRLLYNYINVCQLFFIRFTGKIIKFMEDEDVIKTMTIDDLHEWYETEMYNKMFHKNCMSNKMVLLYKLLNKDSDAAFFNYFYIAFEDLLNIYINKDNGWFKGALNSIYSSILEWMETHILGIISLQLECDHLSDDLLNDYMHIFSKKNITDCDGHNCDSCFFNNPCCPKRTEESQGGVVEEKVHLYITEDQLADLTWIENYIRLITKYHTHAKNIDLVLDFILIEDDTIQFTRRMMNNFTLAENCFKSVKMKNTDSINFGQFENIASKYKGIINE